MTLEACPESDPDARLVILARGGDRTAFDELAERHRPALLALAFLRTGSREDAEDLVQEVLTRAWIRIGTLHNPAALVPWLKSIAANACNTWHRRSQPPHSREPVDEEGATADPAPLHIDELLARESRRELRNALLALPEANRLALLMHAMGGRSYEEIAAFTGVKVTTVEGRIYRARRQLERALTRSAGGLVPASPNSVARSGSGSSEPDRAHTGRKKPMPDVMTPSLAEPYGLAIFTIRLSAAIDIGVSLVRCLGALADLPVPYGPAAADLRREVENGNTLSHAMSLQPALFSETYRCLVRAGEVGGVLEETLQRVAKLSAKEWELACRRPSSEDPLFLTLAAGHASADDWSGLSPYQQKVTLLLFCETFGMLLMSGVPILQALRVLRDLFPPVQRSALDEAHLALRDRAERIGTTLGSLAILPGFVLEMIAIGEETGSLDRALRGAAEALGLEAEFHLAGPRSG